MIPRGSLGREEINKEEEMRIKMKKEDLKSEET
jgi:hypothetical protein